MIRNPSFTLFGQIETDHKEWKFSCIRDRRFYAVASLQKAAQFNDFETLWYFLFLDLSNSLPFGEVFTLLAIDGEQKIEEDLVIDEEFHAEAWMEVGYKLYPFHRLN